MDPSLDSLVNNFSGKIHNRKCIYSMEYKDCKKREECKDKSAEWCEICKDCQKRSDYCKNVTVNVILNS